MNEIDKLRDLWGHVESRAEGRVSVPAGLTRRVRLRKAATSVVAVVGVLAATSLSWAGIRSVDWSQIGGERPSAAPASSPFVPPENGRIAFSTTRGVGMELHSIQPDGSDEEVIPTPRGLPWLHAWSPDGTKIAVSIFSSGNGPRAIWVMNADGSEARKIAEAENVSVPSWSPDGSTIAYAARKGGRTEIHLVAPDGTDDRVLHAEEATGTFAIFSAQFSPDGERIVFDRGTDAGFDIYVIDADGTNPQQLTTTGTDYDPTWSPDGTQIAFTRQGEGTQSDVYVMDADGTNLRQLTFGGNGQTNLSPIWSPDGGKIAYVEGMTGGPGSLIVMNADGSQPATLVDDDVLGISWQPVPA
jgi:Tol biopolymer transport system component